MGPTMRRDAHVLQLPTAGEICFTIRRIAIFDGDRHGCGKPSGTIQRVNYNPQDEPAYNIYLHSAFSRQRNPQLFNFERLERFH